MFFGYSAANYRLLVFEASNDEREIEREVFWKKVNTDKPFILPNTCLR